MSEKELIEKLTKRAERSEELLGQLQLQVDLLSGKLNEQNKQNNKKINKKLLNKQNNLNNNKNELSMEDVETLLLKELDKINGTLDSREFGNKYNLHPNKVYGALSSLEGVNYVKYESKQSPLTVVTQNGQEILNLGSPEYRIYLRIPQSGSISLNEIENEFNSKKELNIGIFQGKSKGWYSFDKNTSLLERKSNNVIDIIKNNLLEIQKGKKLSSNDLKILKKRKLITNKNIKYYLISKDVKFKLERIKPLAKITISDIEKYMNLYDDEKIEENKDNKENKGDWNGPPIKEFNINSLGKPINYGTLHPLMKMREEMRRILLDMGFEEMHTNNYVESSFWNFDSLFQPQQHPARDAHDTFFLKQPSTSKIEIMDYCNRVKKTHESGLDIKESIGWRYSWKESEAKKNLLRTHTTAISSKTLYKLAQQKEFKPKKYFSIDRVFRNEAIDSTHLAEFHQVEGFIADYNLTLGHLIGTIHEFFRRIGIPDVTFKPAYNPYTEPSMEIFGWSEENKKWIEVGNSGVFRPEMLEPMGLPKDVRVCAWGLGLERPCMIATNCKDIRELFGPRVDINMVKKFPFVRYDQKVKQNQQNKKNNKKSKN